MNPYLRAHAEYLKADRDLSWTDALEWHFQVGAVVSTPEVFAMLRPVDVRWSDDEHHAVLLAGPPESHTWHVWALAGSLAKALVLARGHRIEWVTFQRHGSQTVHRANVWELMRRAGG